MLIIWIVAYLLMSKSAFGVEKKKEKKTYKIFKKMHCGIKLWTKMNILNILQSSLNCG